MSTVTTQSPRTEENPPAEPPPPPAASPQPPRIRRWWLRVLVTVLVCVSVLVVAGGVFNWLSSFKQEPPRQRGAGTSRTYSVTVYRVEPVDLQRVITAFGTAVAYREVMVAAEVAGQVVEANRLRVGRPVDSAGMTTSREGTSASTPGDLLVRIDPQTYQARVLQARNLIAQDAADLKRLDQEQENNTRLLETERQNLKTATAEYESVENLRARGVGTESAVRLAELEKARYQDAVNRLENEIRLYESRREAVEARMEAHQSDLELAQLDLGRTHVYAPFAGVISRVHVEQGQYVRPGDQLVRLTDPTRVEVPLSLTLSDYLDIAALRDEGRQLRVALAENETGPPRWFSDPLRDVRQAPEADERTRTVRIYTEVDNDEQSVPLLPGTFVHARIPGPVLNNAMVIPRDAVVKGTVFVAVPLTEEELQQRDADVAGESAAGPAASADTWYARVVRRRVNAGRTLQSLVLISEGLEAGDWIVTTNLDVVHDGARLRIDGPPSQRSLQDELARLRTPQVQIAGQNSELKDPRPQPQSGPDR
jgi:multidrug efflux pump subunit AcrA (membrane-fusion protein)